MREIKCVPAMISDPFIPTKNKRLENASEDVLDAIDTMVSEARDEKPPSVARLTELKLNARRVDDLIENVTGPSDPQYKLTPIGSNENLQALMQRAGFNRFDEVVILLRADFETMAACAHDCKVVEV